MKVGSLVYATNQGLGILARSFYQAGVITDPVVVTHAHHKTHYDWYPDAPRTHIKSFDPRTVVDYLSKCDVVLFFETPFNWKVIPALRKRGVRTVLMPMYECTPKRLPYTPDRFICPSLLDLQYFPDNSVFIPVPVVDVKHVHRKHALTFVHNAGHGGLRSRNGTGELIDAWRLVKSPAKLILRSQKRLQWDADDPRIDVRVGDCPWDQLYSEGDVFVFPEKFNGLSLPLQEAYASGMPVIALDRFPINTWLPKENLVPVLEYNRASIGPAYLEFDEAVVDIHALAAKVDEMYGKDISDQSKAGLDWFTAHIWRVLKPKYMEALCA